MSSSSQTAMPSAESQFESIFSAALGEFKKKTGKNLLDDWLAKELQGCNSVEAVMDIIQGQAEAFDKFKNGGSKLMEWIYSSVHVLHAISGALGDGVGVVAPSAKAVFTGIGVLLAAAKDVRASHDALVDLFERIQFFLKRLGVHTRISPADDMAEILVKIMAEVISILSIATKEMQQSRSKIYIKKLLGRTDIEDALKRLDGLTQEEVRMAIAQVLQSIKLLKDDVKEANEAVREIKDDVRKIKWDQVEQNIRRWFSPPDPSVNYNTAREAYQEGTATWFFRGNIFKKWELVGSLLWIHGKPGSGKSILSSAIIKRVISLRDAGHASLAYFFFDFRDKEKKQDARNFLTSLLIQLSAHSDLCRKIIIDIYLKHGNGTQQPSIGDLKKSLHDMLFVVTRRPVYLIVDALDECPNISGLPTPRAILLSLLEDLIDLRISNLHICVTSRPEADIKIVLEPLANSAVSLHDESGQKQDISDYVNIVVNSDRKMRSWRDADKKLIVEVLSGKADGMFRWVYCQLEVLQHCIIASIRQILDQLPESLDETYARVLSQIPQANQAHAHRLLQCLIAAVRPLRVEELAEVLAFEFDTAQEAVPRYRAGWRSIDQEQAVLSTCSSLITIVDDNGFQVVQFSHFSVKEFLMSDRLTSPLGNFSRYQINLRAAHTILAQACLGFFLHLDDVDNESVWDCPLAQYATAHWSTHTGFQDVALRLKDGMESLFGCDKPRIAAWNRISKINKRDYCWKQWLEMRPTPLYFSSLFGFSDLVKRLALERPLHVNASGGHYGIPLLAALDGEHKGVAEILLKHGADVNSWQMDQYHIGDTRPGVGIVRFLLNHGANVNYRDDDLRTPLHLAALQGRLEVARVLLEHEADVDSCDCDGKTPLHLLYDGDEDPYDDDFPGFTRLLLKYDADVNRRDEENNTPLHLAMSRQMYECAKILIEHGAGASVENSRGKTPLHLLFEDYDDGEAEHFPRAYYCNDCKEDNILDLTRASLGHGMDVNIRMANEWTLLHHVAFRGWRAVARVLLEHGANTAAENDVGETPLHLASGKYRHPFEDEDIEDEDNIAQLLLKHGADVDSRQKNKANPLHSAVFRGRLDIARVLLNYGANPTAENDEGETPLHLVSQCEYLSKEGSVGMVRLLLERGADVDAKKSRTTPLHSAALEGKLEIARVLLDHGANPGAENDEGETPLNLVSRGEHRSKKGGVGIVRLLLERGADVDARKKNKTTPLHSAAFKGRLEIAQVLLDHGANADAENDEGETPLNLVSQGEYYTDDDGVGIVRLLLEHGVDVDACKKNKTTPLHSAILKGRLDIVRALIDRGANPDAENDEGETPLNLVSRSGYGTNDDYVVIARLLLERGVDVDARKKNHTTPLHSAAFNGRLKITQVLLDHGANADAENDEGETPLNLVSRGEYYIDDDGVGIVRLLLERGADVNARKKDNTTPLHSAALKGRLKIARVLLESGANAVAENDERETPLNLLARGEYSYNADHASVARLLLGLGADVNTRNKNKTTPLHSAAFTGSSVTAQVLLDHGANTDMENDQGMTPLHLAAFKGMLEVARVLLGHGANVNVENKQGETPLHVVSQGKSDFREPGLAFARLLLKCGADVNATDKDNYTPFYSASYFGRFDIARLLLEHGAEDAEPISRGTKRNADDVGSRSGKKPKLHEDMHLAPWRHAQPTDLNA